MSVRDEAGGTTTPGEERRAIGTVIASAVGGLRTLARQHVELAKLEVAEAASVRGAGVGMMAAAAVVVMYAIGFVAAAAAAALALVWPVWAGHPHGGSSDGRGGVVARAHRSSCDPERSAGWDADPRDLEGGRSMGEAADRKVTEIGDTRRRLEADLRELEARLPAPLRSTKSLAGVIVGGTALAAIVFRRSRSKRSDKRADRGGGDPRRS